MPTTIPCPLTQKQRQQLRIKIAAYCRKPRTHSDVAERFLISGISAAAFLSWLNLKGICKHHPENGTFKRTSKKFAQ
jgi:hypothetical protein